MNRKVLVNREKVCCLIVGLSVFGEGVLEGERLPQVLFKRRLQLFEDNAEELLKTEIVLHTWRDATFKEIVELLQVEMEQARNPKSKFKFSSVYKDPRGNFKRKDLGTCLSQASSGTTERARTTF